jgi:hypothetical protein
MVEIDIISITSHQTDHKRYNIFSGRLFDDLYFESSRKKVQYAQEIDESAEEVITRKFISKKIAAVFEEKEKKKRLSREEQVSICIDIFDLY